jgi:hypothetical protein
VIDRQTKDFIEGGRALIVGTVDASGQPHATRGWGLHVVDADEGRVRVVLPGDDPVTIENLRTTRRLALTATDVPTLASIQAKGRATAIEPSDAADRRRADRYRDAFFGDIHRVDGTPRALLDRLVPREYVACVAVVDEFYDQTPGPRAGARVGGGDS